MKLDGEKLLVDLNENLKEIKDLIPMVVNSGDWSACIKLDAAEAAINEVVKIIKSGEYTIEEKEQNQ